jgi:Holliday junction resolvase RusA-like endonuclease
VAFRDPHLNDYLDANATWRRTLRLQVETPELLRIGANRGQRQRQEKLLDEARGQLRAAMQKRRRRAFRGEVSVEMHIDVPGDGEAPSAPKSVKRYLDALTGIAYADDRQVGHLLVRRSAHDHAYARRSADNQTHATHKPDRSPSVRMVITPLRLYVADYDRVFAGRGDLTRDRDVDHEALAFFEDDDPHHFGHDELDDLRKERRDDARNEGLYSLYDPELATSMRRHRERRIGELESNLILRARPDRYDRPGPDLAARDNELFEVVGMPALDPWTRYELPGTMWLPPLLLHSRQLGELRWSELARVQLEAHRARWQILPDAFDQPLALDIAIHGAQTTTHDIDNVAHTVLQAFEELYCADRRGTVVAYRVYRQVSNEVGVRVHLMTDRRLGQLDAAIDEARHAVLRDGPRH